MPGCLLAAGSLGARLDQERASQEGGLSPHLAACSHLPSCLPACCKLLIQHCLTGWLPGSSPALPTPVLLPMQTAPYLGQGHLAKRAEKGKAGQASSQLPGCCSSPPPGHPTQQQQGSSVPASQPPSHPASHPAPSQRAPSTQQEGSSGAQ